MRDAICTKLLVTTSLLVAAAGCGSPGIDGFDRWLAGDRLEDERQAAERRERFLQSGDFESLHWLLAHRVRAGMSLSEVNHVLGREGEHIYDAGALKRGDGRYRETDEFYKWGPSSDGRSVYLGFRDDRLLHFDPAEFAE
jgi:hypothetical protein